MFKILVVEDDESFLKIVDIRLRSWRQDVDIVHACSIREARRILDRSKEGFHVAIVDQNLPDGKGSEIIDHQALRESTVLAVSSDDSPELPGATVKAGAHHFLHKRQVTEPLFVPLLDALVTRKDLERQLFSTRLKQSRLETIRTLLSTLRHEINNPLGAVLGGTYILRSSGKFASEHADTIRLIEASGNRIKHVLSQLCETAELETVKKANEDMFHIPGDAPWEDAQKTRKKS